MKKSERQKKKRVKRWCTDYIRSARRSGMDIWNRRHWIHIEYDPSETPLEAWYIELSYWD